MSDTRAHTIPAKGPPEGCCLASFNWGVLRYDWDDPKISEFADNLDRVNQLAVRSDGYLWHMPPEEMEAAQNDATGVLGGNPRFASTLSLWRDADALHQFVFATIHGRFVRKSDAWFAPQGLRHVLWWERIGNIPRLETAVQRSQHLRLHGPSGHAFDWAFIHKPGQ